MIGHDIIYFVADFGMVFFLWQNGQLVALSGGSDEFAMY